MDSLPYSFRSHDFLIQSPRIQQYGFRLERTTLGIFLILVGGDTQNDHPKKADTGHKANPIVRGHEGKIQKGHGHPERPVFGQEAVVADIRHVLLQGGAFGRAVQECLE